MKEVENPSTTALSMNPKYEVLVSQLESWSEDATPLMKGEMLFHGTHTEQNEGPNERNEVLESLLGDDPDVKGLLQDMCSAMATKAKSLFKDHLEGGAYADPSEDLMVKAKNCKPHNIAVERLMAQEDRSLQQITNCRQDNREARIMFSANETAKWLEEKSEGDKENITTRARKQQSAYKLTVKERKKKIKEEIKQCLKAREESKVKKAEQETIRKEHMLEQLNLTGNLWKTKDDMEKYLQGKSKVKIMSALKTQINVRNKILNQPADKTLFAFSKARKAHTIEELKVNLLKLMTMDTLPQITNKIASDPASLVGKIIRHLWKDDDRDVWYGGKILDYGNTGCQFQILYWKGALEQEDDSDEDTYDVTLGELLEDMKAGNLEILN